MKERQSYEESLLEQKDADWIVGRYELVFSSMLEAVVITDGRFVVTHWNKAAEEMFGRNAQDAVGKPFLEIVSTEYTSPDFPEVSGMDVLHILREKQVWKGEVRIRNGEGQWRDVIVSEQAMKGVGGDEIAGIVMLYYDVTDVKAFERRKDNFIAFASHEFKTPLMTLSMLADILEYEVQNDPEKALMSVAKIQRQANELSRLIGALLDFSKIEAGLFKLECATFSLDDLVKETAALLQDTTDRHYICVKGNISRDVYADSDRIAQVLTNLLSNAIKFSPQGGDIVVAIEVLGDMVKVSVSDPGIGIGRRDQENIFERFYRAEGITERTFPGFGIGLTISREIIRKHGGEIGVKSEKGSGSTFFFTLPYSGETVASIL